MVFIEIDQCVLIEIDQCVVIKCNDRPFSFLSYTFLSFSYHKFSLLVLSLTVPLLTTYFVIIIPLLNLSHLFLFLFPFLSFS